jgi:IS66 Orf2 like protein
LCRHRVRASSAIQRRGVGFWKRRDSSARAPPRWRAARHRPQRPVPMEVGGHESIRRGADHRRRSSGRKCHPLNRRHDVASSNCESPPGLRLCRYAQSIDRLAMPVHDVLRQQDPFSGHLFVFRGRTRANLIKVVFWRDGVLFSPIGPSKVSSCGTPKGPVKIGLP